MFGRGPGCIFLYFSFFACLVRPALCGAVGRAAFAKGACCPCGLWLGRPSFPLFVRSTLAFRGELAHFPLSVLAEIVWAPLASRSVGSPLPGGDCSARRLEPPASPPPSCPPQAPRAPEPSLGPAPGWVRWRRGYRLGSRGPAGVVASGHGCRSPTFVLFFSCSPSYGASCSFTLLKSQRFWDCAFSRRWLLLTPMRGRLSAPAPYFSSRRRLTVFPLCC